MGQHATAGSESWRGQVSVRDNLLLQDNLHKAGKHLPHPGQWDMGMRTVLHPLIIPWWQFSHHHEHPISQGWRLFWGEVLFHSPLCPWIVLQWRFLVPQASGGPRLKLLLVRREVPLPLPASSTNYPVTVISPPCKFQPGLMFLLVGRVSASPPRLGQIVLARWQVGLGDLSRVQLARPTQSTGLAMASCLRSLFWMLVKGCPFSSLL